jgi:hypothetical protein
VLLLLAQLRCPDARGIVETVSQLLDRLAARYREFSDLS